jgi:hypothetical protein
MWTSAPEHCWDQLHPHYCYCNFGFKIEDFQTKWKIIPETAGSIHELFGREFMIWDLDKYNGKELKVLIDTSSGRVWGWLDRDSGEFTWGYHMGVVRTAEVPDNFHGFQVQVTPVCVACATGSTCWEKVFCRNELGGRKRVEFKTTLGGHGASLVSVTFNQSKDGRWGHAPQGCANSCELACEVWDQVEEIHVDSRFAGDFHYEKLLVVVLEEQDEFVMPVGTLVWVVTQWKVSDRNPMELAKTYVCYGSSGTQPLLTPAMAKSHHSLFSRVDPDFDLVRASKIQVAMLEQQHVRQHNKEAKKEQQQKGLKEAFVAQQAIQKREQELAAAHKEALAIKAACAAASRAPRFDGGGAGMMSDAEAELLNKQREDRKQAKLAEYEASVRANMEKMKGRFWRGE